ncbi:MAG: methyltransferase [Propionibacteriaceae bacterium]|jgi:16S rRNA G1207 methylase RsmC|nr:methyltransferase [Propionibacteriaceae bacterium]
MSQYFETPNSQLHTEAITATIWGREYTFTTANGVFSGSRLDPGTAVLFRDTEPPSYEPDKTAVADATSIGVAQALEDSATGTLATGANSAATSAPRFLDLGCGYGPIAIALATECPWARIDAVDTNERALELTRRNAAAHGVADRVRCFTPDEADSATTYDEIWSNPPIRIGKEALHELLLTWLARLTPTGTATLVVNKNLGADSLQSWLETQSYPTQRLGSAKGFRVLRVTPSR